MTDSTDNARGPERIAFRKAYMSHAITSGPLMNHPDYVQYVRADLAPGPLADARVKALVEALKRIAEASDHYSNEADAENKGADALAYAHKSTCNLARAALAAFDKGGKTDG